MLLPPWLTCADDMWVAIVFMFSTTNVNIAASIHKLAVRLVSLTAHTLQATALTALVLWLMDVLHDAQTSIVRFLCSCEALASSLTLANLFNTTLPLCQMSQGINGPYSMNSTSAASGFYVLTLTSCRQGVSSLDLGQDTEQQPEDTATAQPGITADLQLCSTVALPSNMPQPIYEV